MWKRMNIYNNLIKAETTKAVLIAMPHKSNYDGYTFWHPQKLVRFSKNSESISIVYTDNFKFHIKKYGKGKYNRNKIIDEIEIDVEELLRLKQISGLAALFKDREFSNSWE